mmetsp:Transcript_1912/g.4062  ORF Transcript_1912/g.4062 Transcript_1912/m.4062 type:complete len:249 (-) Transcript_1912:319-1065(-)|eukprot:CAMPEP_0201163428 /NCGR_PEP_ID=MMETSP0851-20130426/56082_1 /ASSEMBLY_ACC=CAM_ASM_000631 /TAXON_ID=183588 /ORGANISM="Pseudo-nitzschia fraudulenta, Strain WWA7" /LENGTH=248 /DNA_ID=CAMNT_0047443553 /DNA_START=67 /DNA_END=813 /DNA_ORIENTATION=-
MVRSTLTLFCIGVAALSTADAFTPNSKPSQILPTTTDIVEGNAVSVEIASTNRRGMLLSAGTFTVAAVASMVTAQPASAEVNLQQYEDFTKAPEGWSYRDVNVGAGDSPSTGDRAVFEWSGYTIGYFGRPFEAKGGPQGGAFDKNQDYSRTVIGKGDVVKGLDLAMQSMKVGGIRQIIVPYGELGYPSTKDDGSHDKIGPKPSTFSGERALNFVLDNPRVDRTLLFNVKLIRVDKSDGKGGFKRGDRA